MEGTQKLIKYYLINTEFDCLQIYYHFKNKMLYHDVKFKVGRILRHSPHLIIKKSLSRYNICMYIKKIQVLAVFTRFIIFHS